MVTMARALILRLPTVVRTMPETCIVVGPPPACGVAEASLLSPLSLAEVSTAVTT